MLLSEDSILDTFYSQKVEKSSQSPTTKSIQPPSCFYTQQKENQPSRVFGNGSETCPLMNQSREFGIGQSNLPYSGIPQNVNATLALTKQNSSASLNTTNNQLYSFQNSHNLTRARTVMNTSQNSIGRHLTRVAGRDLSP